MRKLVSVLPLHVLVLLVFSLAVFAQNEEYSLEQCRNGTFEAPAACVGLAWANGSANSLNAHWWEGESVPFRANFAGLAPGQTYSITLGWSTTVAEKNAIDYLTSYNRTAPESTDACSGVVCGTINTFPIPLDPTVAAAGVVQPSGQVFTIWGGTITQVSAYGSSGSDRTITITFTAGTVAPVLAWGAHIADRQEWYSSGGTITELAVASYHVSISSSFEGLQDLGLSNNAVRRNSLVRIIDQASPESAQEFNFTTSGEGLSNFLLVDDGTDNDSTPNSVVFEKLLAIGESRSFTVSNNTSGDYNLAGISCSVSPDGTSSTIPEPSARLVSITLQYGDTVTCTFNHALPATEVCPEPVAYWIVNSAAWPVNSLTLGTQTYSQSELLKLLSRSPGKGKGADASMVLAHQLIAAKLNLASGADGSSIQDAIADADDLLSSYPRKLPYRVKTTAADGQLMVTTADALEAFNTAGCSQ